jgi:hypothetical protein
MKMQRYATKLLLNLCIIGLEIALIWTGYNTFTQQWKPIYGAIIFISNIAILWFCLSIVRQKRFRYQRPGLFKTTLALIAIAIICTFAGIQPLASYKDSLITSYQVNQAEQTAEREKAAAEKAAKEAKAEKYPKGLYMTTDALTFNSYINFISEDTLEMGNSLLGKDILKYELLNNETQIKAIGLTDSAFNFEGSFQYIKEIECVVIEGIRYFKTSQAQTVTEDKQSESTKYETLFNEYRIKNGRSPLVFSPRLNEIAQLRVEEIKKDFSHSGISKYGNFGENIVQGVYSDNGALEVWSNSSGHRANMLDPTYHQTGYARSGSYAVQIFD